LFLVRILHIVLTAMNSSADKTIKVWDLAARAAVSTIQENAEVWAVSWQPASGAASGGAFVTGSEDGMVKDVTMINSPALPR
jgi:WD repeat-containing protein 61